MKNNYQDIVPNYSDCENLQKITYCSFENKNEKWVRGQERFIDTMFADVGRGLKILDAACGDGVGLRYFKYLRFTNITGVEFNPKKVEIAQQTGYDVLQRDIMDLSCFADETFDIVYSSHTLEHIYYPGVTINWFHRILKPNGLLYVVLPFPDLGEKNDKAHGAKYELGTHIAGNEKKVIEYFTEKGFNLVSYNFDDYREPEIWLVFQKNK